MFLFVASQEGPRQAKGREGSKAGRSIWFPGDDGRVKTRHPHVKHPESLDTVDGSEIQTTTGNGAKTL